MIEGSACPRCHRRTPGLGIGALCADCREATDRRAARWARWIALASTLVLGLYLLRVLRPLGPALRASGRNLALGATLAWAWLSYRVAKEVALLCLR